VLLQIGSVRFEISAPRSAALRLERRFGPFVRPPSTPLRPHVRLTAPAAGRPPREGSGHARELIVTVGADGHYRLDGACSASFDPRTGVGQVEAGDEAVGLDALVRLSLSTVAVDHGWILLHGAAVELASGAWAVLAGRSGAGKSTAARAFASLCDDLVLVRPDDTGLEAASTPYWNGRAGTARCAVVACLERAADPATVRLNGAAALREIARHVVRVAPSADAERRGFTRLGALISRVPVVAVRSAPGPTYPASLAAALATIGFPPRAAA
jgi:hypothetical protein